MMIIIVIVIIIIIKRNVDAFGNDSKKTVRINQS
jgi:hypothetical protein